MKDCCRDYNCLHVHFWSMRRWRQHHVVATFYTEWISVQHHPPTEWDRIEDQVASLNNDEPGKHSLRTCSRVLSKLRLEPKLLNIQCSNEANILHPRNVGWTDMLVSFQQETLKHKTWPYLFGFANILLQIDKNCMILSSKCRSSSPLKRYIYLQELRILQLAQSTTVPGPLPDVYRLWNILLSIGSHQNNLLRSCFCR